MPAIVVSSYTMGLGVIRALGTMGVPVHVVRYDDHDMGHVSRYVRRVYRAPHPVTSEECFVERLVDLGPRIGRGLLVPASDAAVAAISRHRELLERHYLVAAPPWEVTERFLEKERTYELAEQVGVPAPRSFTPRSLADVERFAEVLGFPSLVKPSQGHLFKARFGLKMVEVRDLGQMRSWYRRATDAGLTVMLQELIPGPDAGGANYNAYFWDGEPLAEFTARKVRNSPPRFGSPRVAISELVPEVLEPGRAILRALGLEGFACTEFKRDIRDGIWKLMEVNGRHNLSSLLAVRSGVNFPWIQYRHLVDGEIPRASSQEVGKYWIDLVRDLGCLPQVRREGYSFAEYMRPYVSPHVFAILDVQDPRPFAVRCKDLSRTALLGLLRRTWRPARPSGAGVEPIDGDAAADAAVRPDGDPPTSPSAVPEG
ncbi:MAG TPA: hypothetical protein VF029_02055 [Actinomycetota bacterium]